MKKITLPLFGLVLLVACQKKDLKTTEQETQLTESVSERVCAADEVLQMQIATDPVRAKQLEELEEKTANYKGRAQGANFRTGAKLYVPVVVHVVLANPNNVTDQQIQRQLDVLNKDFNRTNSELANSNVYLAGYNYANVANCNIEFYLSGSVIRKTTSATFGSNDAVKRTSSGGSSPLNATTKLNLWVCDLSSGLLGYAQFPGGSSATDGVVIDYQAFGTQASYPMYSAFNLGRTATHEVGHWVNLRHIWGDRRCGDDLVGDTPAHDAANGGCPSQGLKSSCSGKPLEQWMNYMDYTNDACMYMFTSGQKTRMDAAIDASRAAYFSTVKG